ncbi:hypothetical protein D6D27_02525 [Aureobasidium pullulans]|nr:hypothetical protein D6D27_02525 [Aureobasidium pullulans]
MASLLSLPPEIFEAVLEDVDGDDVLNLRRVNRRISALSTHQFGLKCLADLSFFCHQDSLKGLLELVAHPLGRYIKRLTFSTHVDWPFQGPLVDKIERERPRVLDTWDFGKSSSPLTQALRTLDGLGIRPILGIYDPLRWTIPEVAGKEKDTASTSFTVISKRNLPCSELSWMPWNKQDFHSENSMLTWIVIGGLKMDWTQTCSIFSNTDLLLQHFANLIWILK